MTDANCDRETETELELEHIIEVTEAFLLFVKKLHSVNKIIDRQPTGEQKAAEFKCAEKLCSTRNDYSMKCMASEVHHSPIDNTNDTCTMNRDRGSCKFIDLPTSSANKGHVRKPANECARHCNDCAFINLHQTHCTMQNEESPSSKIEKNKKRTGNHVSTMIKALTSQFQSKNTNK